MTGIARCSEEDLYFRALTTQVQFVDNPIALFDEVAFDQRWDAAMADAVRADAMKAGFINVVQSELYRLPDFTWKVGSYSSIRVNVFHPHHGFPNVPAE